MRLKYLNLGINLGSRGGGGGRIGKPLRGGWEDREALRGGGRIGKPLGGGRIGKPLREKEKLFGHEVSNTSFD